MHYIAAKIGRGEIFEAIDGLSFVRARVLGPLSLAQHGAPPFGVRKLEFHAGEDLEGLRKTVPGYNRHACIPALEAAASLYVRLRDRQYTPGLVQRNEAQEAALTYLAEVRDRALSPGR